MCAIELFRSGQKMRTKIARLTTLLAITLTAFAGAKAQTDQRPVDPDSRLRSIVISAPPKPAASPVPAAPIKVASPQAVSPAPPPQPLEENGRLSPAKIHTKITEVKRLLRSRPSLTSISSPAVSIYSSADSPTRTSRRRTTSSECPGASRLLRRAADTAA